MPPNNIPSPSALQQRIVERIQHEELITFADYMRMALYEPGYGYYVSGATRVGWEGDFYTSTDVSNLFAHCMGRQLYQMWQTLGTPAPFTVLEQGAGRGDLARGIQQWASEHEPDFQAALDYHTIDIGSGQDALAQGQDVQQGDRQGSLVQWYDTPSVIISNELVDAFPVHIVEKRGSRLYEVYVTIEQGRFAEVLSEPSSEAVADYLDSYKIPWTTFDDGWRAEINLDALSWIERSAAMLSGGRKRRGFLLAIDYGDKAKALYTRDRRRGTLACYFKHQLTEQPLLRPGEQDITAHVNFTALIQAGRQHKLRLHAFTTQELWLKEQGIYEELEQIRARDFAIIDTARGSNQGQAALLQWYNQRQRAAALTDPYGMGNFKVLILKS